METRNLSAGSYLFKPGDQDDSIYVVQSGKLKVTIKETVSHVNVYLGIRLLWTLPGFTFLENLGVRFMKQITFNIDITSIFLSFKFNTVSKIEIPVWTSSPRED